MIPAELTALADRVALERGMDNALDVLCELALFRPDDEFTAIRANAAGTKTICTRKDSTERTFWARDFTISSRSRAETVAALRAFAAMQERADA